MELKNKKILVLGGGGLVGSNLIEELLNNHDPGKIIISSLEGDREKNSLKIFGKNPRCKFAWGNIFVNKAIKDKTISEIVQNEKDRNLFLRDTIFTSGANKIENNFLYELINQEKPDIIIDCINTATVMAYQNIFYKRREIYEEMQKDTSKEDLKRLIEELLSIDGIPLLLHHVRSLFKSLKDTPEVKTFLKVGTTGTGGLGFNLPFTHGEERPSSMVLAKAGLSGAYTQLLVLLSRTPDFPEVFEVKPAGAIGGKVFYGEILNSVENAYLDMGESGFYGQEEFRLLTSPDYMGYLPVKTVVDKIINTLKGAKDNEIIHSINNSLIVTSKRDMKERKMVLNEMDKLAGKNNKASLAFKSLGPPFVTKLIYEIYILKEAGLESEALVKYINEKGDLRNEILSLGIPIILPGDEVIPANNDDVEIFIDLRKENIEVWIKRLEQISDLNKYSPGQIVAQIIRSERSLI